MRPHQTLPELAMIRHIKVRQLVYNDVVRQFPIERQQVIAEVQISRLIWPTISRALQGWEWEDSNG